MSNISHVTPIPAPHKKALEISGSILCIGDALVDVITTADGSLSEHVGGSPLNVACGLGRLEHKICLAGWWGKDSHGQAITQHLTAHQVAVLAGSDQAPQTGIADAQLDHEGRATYRFDLEWKMPKLPADFLPTHLHTGSFAATMEPGGSSVLAAVKKTALTTTVSYDPNVRPALMEDPQIVRERIEEIVSLSDVVKASDEDIAWLYGNEEPVEKVMRNWLRSGPGLVVVTRGPWGAYALLAGDRDMLVIDPLNVEVGDTVGAGDSFMAGLISGLLDARLLGSGSAKQRLRTAHWEDVRSALHRAVITSGLTVSRAGAYSPDRVEIAQIIAASPELG